MAEIPRVNLNRDLRLLSAGARKVPRKLPREVPRKVPREVPREVPRCLWNQALARYSRKRELAKPTQGHMVLCSAADYHVVVKRNANKFTGFNQAFRL